MENRMNIEILQSWIELETSVAKRNLSVVYIYLYSVNIDFCVSINMVLNW
jgi:hypothetical protein